MKLSANIPGRRKGESVEITLSAEGETLSFEVPSVARSAAASFEMEVGDLREALEILLKRQPNTTS